MSDEMAVTQGTDSAASTAEPGGSFSSGAEAVFNLFDSSRPDNDGPAKQVEGNENQSAAPGTDEPDEEILKAFEQGDEDEQETGAEEEVKQEENDVKAGQKEKEKAPKEEPAEEGVKPQEIVSLPEELLADALYSPESLGAALNSVAAAVTERMEKHAAALAEFVQDQVQRALAASEIMLYLHEAAKESPEILQYPQVMKRLLQKHMAAGAGDKIVQNALGEFKNAYSKFASLKKGGNKIVDVRANTSPPKSASKPMSSGGIPQAEDVNNIGYLASILNKSFRKE